MSDGAQLLVYTDGGCPFCLWARRKFVDPWDDERRIEFRDFNDPSIAAETPFLLVELVRQMHVQTPDKRWHVGYFGWIAVLQALPRRRWLARIMNLPPLRWSGPLLYRLVASNRYRISRVFFRAIGVSPCGETCVLPRKS